MNAKKIVICVALIGLLAMGGQAMAEIGTIDAVPAATLLLPYFEVSLGGGGVNTLFSINNASAAPAVAHVTIWTDQSVPVLDFDVYLTGYDVQSINLFDIIGNGILPQTGPGFAGSPQGLFSIAGARTFPSCGSTPGEIPVYNPLGATFLAVVQAALTGQPIPAGVSAGLCAGADYGDAIARGYVTVDSVNDCSQDFPSSPGYFIDGGQGTADNNNILWGDYFIIDSANNFAQGETLVHVEADGAGLAAPTSCDTADFNPTTFYCRYTAIPGADNREALGSMYANRYLNGGPFTGGTDILYYRDPNFETSPFVCSPANYLALTQNQFVVFDEEENPITQDEGPSGFIPAGEDPFPFEAGRTVVGTDLTVQDNFGWIYLNLNGANGVQTEHNQAWITSVLSASGLFSVGYDAIQLNNLTLGTDEANDNLCLGIGGPSPCA